MTVQYLRALHPLIFPGEGKKVGRSAPHSPAGGRGSKAVSQGLLSGCCRGGAPSPRERRGLENRRLGIQVLRPFSGGRGEVRTPKEMEVVGLRFFQSPGWKEGGLEWKLARKRDGRLGICRRLPVRKGHRQFSFLRFPCPSSRVASRVCQLLPLRLPRVHEEPSALPHHRGVMRPRTPSTRASSPSCSPRPAWAPSPPSSHWVCSQSRISLTSCTQPGLSLRPQPG